MHAASLDRISAELADADVVLSAVAAESHVLHAEDFAGVTGPLLVIDLGVPRNIDPAVAALPGVTLLDMDRLSAAVARALGDREKESVAARAIIATEVERFRTASRQRGAAPVISSLRARLESLREAELERRRAQLADLSQEEWDQVDAAHEGRAVQDAARADDAPEGDGRDPPRRAARRGAADPLRPLGAVAVVAALVTAMG